MNEATYLFMGGLVEVTLALPSGTVTGSRSYYTVEGQMLAMSDGSSTSYLLTDHLGSVVGVDGFGALVSEQRYLPFGEARTDLTGITATDLSFTGQRALTGTGLIDYHARQYDPALRAFIQADSVIPNPYGVLDYNRYLYVHANPVRFTDPSGNRCFPINECKGPAGQGEPESIDYSKLTQKSKNVKYSGQEMAKLYLAAWEAKGGYLSVRRFVTLMLSYEFQPISNVTDSFTAGLREAAGNWFWCSPNAETNSCTNIRENGGATPAAMLNWVAGMESARRRFDNIKSGANAWDQINDQRGNYSLAFTVMEFILSESDANGHIYLNTPFYWANKSILTNMGNIEDISFGWNYNQYLFIFSESSGDPFFILTPCQTYYWRGQKTDGCS